MHRGMILAAVLLAGCAYSYEPVVDMQGVDQAKYDRDLAECRGYADQVSPVEEAAGAGLLSAAIGAALGAVVGAVSGGVSAGGGAAAGAAVGGTAGVVTGGVGAGQSQVDIIKKCLSGRGYRLLR